MSRSLPLAALRAASSAIIALIAMMSASVAVAQDRTAAKQCGDLSLPPKTVAAACRKVADDAKQPVGERAAAAFRAGAAYLKLKSYALAEDSYSAAIKLDAKLADAYAGRASAREELKKTAEAEADHNMAVSLKPTDARTIYNRGVFYFRSDKEKQARNDFYKAIELDPKAGWPRVYLGAIDDLKGKDDLALGEYEAAFRLDPSILSQFQLSLESQGYKAGVPGKYTDEMRKSLIECMKKNCVIGKRSDRKKK
ncbi:MAG: hypothetical protein MRY74_05345 [Neomegalonema sp.]|nr:hypothetical protein [Neomegalonema sp.]